VIGPNLSEWAIKSRPLTIYLMLVAVVAGVLAFINLGRDEDPSFTIKTMLVTAVWPGASMDETLNQVTERLERTLQETPGLDSLRSITRPGLVTVYIDIEGAYPPEKVPDSWYEVRKKVGDIRHTLPQGVLGPFFNDDFGDVFGILYGFTADGFTHRELRDYVDQVRSALIRDVPLIEKVEFIGAQDEEIVIELVPDRVAAMGLDYGQVFAAIAAQNTVRPAGTINSGKENLSLRVSGTFEKETDILEAPINAGGRMIRLGDIAEVKRGFVDPPSPMYRVNGKPAIGLGISMREGGDVLQLGRDVSASVERATGDLPIGIDVFLVSNQPKVVTAAIGDFTTSLYQAVLIILAVSFVTLGLRPGAVVAIAIPVTLATVFLIMQTLGIDLHRVSLGALIIALALLVDDAMTTVDATLRRLAIGEPMEKATTFAYSRLAAAMLTGTLITIAGFVPIGFAESQAGEYTISLFQVVAIALLTSWFVAVLFTPIVATVLLKPPKATDEEGKPGFLLQAYSRLLEFAIRMRWLTIALAALLFAVSLYGFGQVNRQFFPPSDRNELIVDFQLPRSNSIFASETAVEKLEGWLAKSKDVDFWSSYVGRNVIRFYLPLAILPPSDHHSQLVIMAKNLDARKRLEKDLRDYLTENFPEAISRVSPLEMGPPIGWPLQWRLSGPDIEVLRDKAFALAEIIASHPASDRVHFDWIEPARKLRIEIDQDQARRLGLTSQNLASALQTAVSGAPITQLRDNIYLVDVVARAHSNDRISLDNLSTLQIPVPGGRTVALSAFANFSFEQEQPLVWRRDRTPTLTVLADVKEGTTPETVVDAMEGKIDDLAAKLPSGYWIEIGGTAETSTESQEAVFAVVPLMTFIMLTLLMVQLQSFAKTVMVLLLLPLGLIGVVGALLLFRQPLGFVAILGMLALLGMIAKNAVILIVQTDEERANGLSVQDAVMAAAIGRLRPIMLTALSTVLGLIPIAPTLFWGPMAFAIMGGLLIATLLTLILLPVLYVTWYGGDGKPQAETGEPTGKMAEA
jgi:multidrug efflux pump subunit AcrB